MGVEPSPTLFVSPKLEQHAQRWFSLESTLLDSVIELFKERCTREAEQQRCGITVCFYSLCKAIKNFPKREKVGASSIVGSWGGNVAGESWFCANPGRKTSVSPDAVLYVEVLERLMPKFLERLKPLGFETCSREKGTWKVTVSWAAQPPPEDELSEEPMCAQPLMLFSCVRSTSVVLGVALNCGFNLP